MNTPVELTRMHPEDLAAYAHELERVLSLAYDSAEDFDTRGSARISAEAMRAIAEVVAPYDRIRQLFVTERWTCNCRHHYGPNPYGVTAEARTHPRTVSGCPDCLAARPDANDKKDVLRSEYSYEWGERWGSIDKTSPSEEGLDAA